MGDRNRHLRVVEDPVTEIVYLLRGMPVGRLVAYLVLVANEATRLGVLTPEDRLRVGGLVNRVLAWLLDRAA